MKRRLISKQPAFVSKRDIKARIVAVFHKLRAEKMAVLGMVLLIGVTTLLLVRAAPFTANIEPESAACGPMVQSNTQASGGSFVRFAPSACATSCSGQVTNGYCWKPLRLGAGGFATGIDTASDGTRVVRTDSAGAYTWDTGLNGGEWRPLITKSALTGTGLDTPKSGGGVHAVAIAQSNPSVFYMAWKGYVLKSTNKGRNWTKLNIEGTDMNPNADCRAWGGRLMVDPQNENVVYFGSIMKGLYVSSDGNNFSKVASVPVAQNESYCDDGGGTIPSAGVTGIAFDKSSGLINGKTKTIYLSSHKNGIYRSTDGGASFSAIGGGPTSAVHGHAANGNYYALGFNGQGARTTVWRYSGSWTNITPSNWDGVVTRTEVPTLTIDYKNPNTVAIADHAAELFISTNNGGSWVKETGHTMVAPDMPWLQSEQYLVTSQIAFDGQVANKIWLALGTGVAHTTVNPSSIGNVTWTHQSKGMEQLVQNDVISPPFTTQGQARLNLAVSDFGTFRINDPDQFNASRWPVQRFTGTWSLDWASQAPNVIVHNTTDILASQIEAGYSVDGGLTSQRFATMPVSPPGGFGTIAAGDASHFLWQTTGIWPYDTSSKQARVWYSENAGGSWQDVTPGDISDLTGLHNGYFTKKKNVAYDRVTPGVAYLYYNNQSVERVYKSINYGKNWTKVFEVTPVTAWENRDKTLAGSEGFWNPTMKTVPGKSGNLFITGGPSGADRTIGNKDASGSKMMFSANGGTTWTRVNGVNGIYGFGFGKEKSGTSYPAIFVSGFVQPAGQSEEFGIWRGDGFDPATGNVTWTKIGDYPNGNMSQIFSIDGDKQVYGKVYLSTGSDGAFYGVPQ